MDKLFHSVGELLKFFIRHRTLIKNFSRVPLFFSFVNKTAIDRLSMKIIISKDPLRVVCYLGTISFAADERLNTKETLQSFSINNKL